MDIRKADSKGRLTGFAPERLYAFNRETGTYSEVYLKAPNGNPIEEELGRTQPVTPRMRIFSFLKGEGKTTKLVDLMFEPGNEDVVYVAPTKAQAENAWNLFVSKRGYDLRKEVVPLGVLKLRKRFIAASGLPSLPENTRIVIDEVDGVLSYALGHPVLAIAGTDPERQKRHESN